MRTIEEKAKAYDEAIKRVNDLISRCKTSRDRRTMIYRVDDIESIFPELAESGDERIRKALISFLKSPFVNENITDEKVTPWIAWLEKQGSQILANSAKTCKDEQKPADKVDQYSLPVSDNSSLPTFDESIYHPCTEEVYEQKPTEWSEEDEKTLNSILSCIKHCQDEDIEARYNGNRNVDPKRYESMSDWLKSLKDRVQPKQEWSKEDEKILDGVITNYESGYLPSVEKRDEIIEKLESIKDRLQPQPKQEWSEENEKMLKDTIRFCELCGNQVSSNWLKSLRPQSHWKPSEGQLECLGYAIEKAEKDWSPLANNRIYLTLKALKEQLEKL